jgi:hypothetical protein
MSGTVGGMLWKGETFDIGSGAYGTRREVGIIKIDTFNSMAEAFYANMPH